MLQEKIEALRDEFVSAKPNDRSDPDRIYAILITDLEKLAALAAYHKI